MTDTKPDVKAEVKAENYRLKESETRLLVVARQNMDAVFSMILATIAVDRLGYNVTDHTQFKLGAQFDMVEISELPPAPVPVAKAPEDDEKTPPEPQAAPAAPPQPPADPKAGAVAAQ